MKEILEHIVITGASSGIGKALAMEYSQPEIVLSLCGRNEDRLSEIAQSCVEKGAVVYKKIIDVADCKAMSDWLIEIDSVRAVDLVIANAGISAGTGNEAALESRPQIDEVFDVNLKGVLNTIHPLMDQMIDRQSGQIALMSSLAGFRGWPGAPAYCASKAAVKVYGESLRANMAKHNVKVNVICPGFVKSPMTDANDFPMPFMISSEKASKIIKRGLRKNKSRISFPAVSLFFAWFFSFIPDGLAHLFLSKTPSKKAS